MEVKDDSRIKEYLDKVCSRIRSKRSHKQIEEELCSHIEEKKRDYVSCGISEDEAVEKCLRDMGSSEVLGEELNKVHKEKVDWVILSIVGILIGLSFISMCSSRGFSYQQYSDENFYINKMVVYIAVGLIFFAISSVIDYRKMKKYSAYIYVFSIMILGYLCFWGDYVNGRRSFITIVGFSINLREVMMGLFLISITGIFESINWKLKIQRIYGVILALIPLIGITILMKPLGIIITYIISLVILLNRFYKSKRVAVISICLSIILILGTLLIVEENMFLHNMVTELLESSVLIGEGSGVNTFIETVLDTDLVITKIIYNFGWVFGIGAISIVLFFIIKLFSMIKTVNGQYGKNLLLAMSTMLGVQYFLSIGYNLGITEVGGVSVPFISYGGSGIVISLFIIGIIINILKGKDLKEG